MMHKLLPFQGDLRMNHIMLLSFFLCFQVFQGFASDFIRQISTINIPNAPLAYNASCIECDEGFLLVFRHDEYRAPLSEDYFYQRIGLVKLDDKFTPTENPTICHELGNRAYDPRIVKIGDKIYLTYVSARPTDIDSFRSSQICLTEVDVSKKDYKLSQPLPLIPPSLQTWEKNWVPFDYQGSLMLGYNINPHVIFSPSLNTGVCSHLFTTAPSITWHQGIIRGGTPAILVDDEYLAIFHSSCHNHITGRRTYYMGAYTFQSQPPFCVTRTSTIPFSHVDFYSTPKCPLTPSDVIFPGSIVIKGNSIFVVYGENDCGIKVMELDKDLLYQSLKSVH